MYQIIRHPINEESCSVRRMTDGASIPTDPANADYAAFLAWLEEGNTPEPWQPDAE